MNIKLNSTIALCIPAFNAAKYLTTLLTSAKKQALPFDEILVYDDCSTDNTAAVARAFGATVIEGDVNLGCSTGKNRLAEIAKSEWLHFHDADDVLLANFTEVAHRWINKADAPDIVLMHFQYKDFVTHKLLGEPDYSAEELKKDPVKFNILNKVVNFAIIKRSSFQAIGGFNTDPEVLYNEDRAFYTKASLQGLTFDYDNELTCINYYYPGSMSAANKGKCAKAGLKVWDTVIEQTHGLYNKDIAHQLFNNATFAATANDWMTVKRSVKKAKQIFPGIMPEGSIYFKCLYKIFSFQAFFIREMLIRHLTSKRSK
jgi:glycosyltransferase involved in cell wall biosynthesis